MRNITAPEVRADIRNYVETNIIPCYDSYDKAHSRSHILTVINQSMELFRKLSAKGEHGPDGLPLSPDMVYVIAAYHDLGVCEGREMHHIVLRQDADGRYGTLQMVFA